MTDIDDPSTNPDCVNGKHAACSGGGWNMSADMPCACRCDCHKPKPKRVRLSRKKGQRKPEGAIVVSRPSKWGNPFTLEHGRDWAVDTYTSWLLIGAGRDIATAARTELRGHDLACWCPLDERCHADVLLEVANGGAS